jgi:hypothetical protein
MKTLVKILLTLCGLNLIGLAISACLDENDYVPYLGIGVFSSIILALICMLWSSDLK